MFWLKGRYYFASHNGFVVEGFAAVLMDGRPLPASSEQLNERGAVITRLPTLLPEERGKQEGGGGSKRAGWWASDGQCVKVGEDDRESSRTKKREGRKCLMEEVSTGCNSPHTPIPEGTAESPYYVNGEEQVVLWRSHNFPTKPVINRPAGLFKSMVKCSSDSGVPWHD